MGRSRPIDGDPGSVVLDPVASACSFGGPYFSSGIGKLDWQGEEEMNMSEVKKGERTVDEWQLAIDELKERKRTMEQVILNELREFSLATGGSVNAVNLRTSSIHRFGQAEDETCLDGVFVEITI